MNIQEDRNAERVNDTVQIETTRFIRLLPISCSGRSGTPDDPLHIQIRDFNKPVVKVAVVQLNFELSTDSFPFQISNKRELKKKVLKAVNIARTNRVDIICLPELCICEDWIETIQSISQDMLVIPGSYYDAENHNVCKPFMDFQDISSQMKQSPSTLEIGVTGQRMVPGNRFNIYLPEVGKFSILICRDFINHHFHFRDKVDIIFVPSYNEEVRDFQDNANVHVTRSPSYIVIANTAVYGGTSVFGIIHKKHQSELINKGCKMEGDSTYKLCELKKGEEGMIIADFDLVHKSIQVPTPADPHEEIRPVSNIRKEVIDFKSTSVNLKFT